MSTPGTLQHYIDGGYRIYANHQVLKPYCSHSSELDLVALREKLGADYDIVRRRGHFLALLRCAKCGGKGNIGLTVVPPEWRPGQRPMGLAV